ncbi:MAG: T9SS type A sorting domain-containing protein [Bacteroidota bacterium]
MTRLYAILLVLALLAPAASGQPLNSVVEAYVWGDQPTAASYAPAAAYSYNASGGTNTVVRTDVGRYTLTLGGIPDIRNGNRGNVQVSAYGSNAVCMTGGFGGAPFIIRVICRAPVTDAFVDSQYTVLFTRSGGTSPLTAYAFANRPESESPYAPNAVASHNAGGGSILAGQVSSAFRITFPGFAPPSAIDVSGIVLLTGGGTTATGGSARCGLIAYSTRTDGTLVVDNQCNGVDGAPLIARHSVLFLKGETADGGPAFGYTHANDRTAASYTPPANRTFSQNGGAVTAERVSQGRYRVTFAGLGGSGTFGGSVQVTPFAQIGGYCTVNGWVTNGPDAVVRIHCWDTTGQPFDLEYTVLFTWPDNVVNAVSAETGPNDAALALALAGPNPTASRTAVAVTLAEAGIARVAVTDLLGREVAVLADGPLAAGTTRLDLDASALPAGVYVARVVTGGLARTLRFTVAR